MSGADQSKSFLRKDFRTLTEDDLKSFEADLMASIESFQVPGPAQEVMPRSVTELGPFSQFPEISDQPDVRPAAARAPTASAAAASPSGSSVGGGLLDELRSAATIKQASDDEFRAHKKQTEALVAAAMRQLWDYLNELSRHLNTLKPPVATLYRLAPKAELDGFVWSESFIDYRTVGNSETAPIDSISLRFTLAALGTLAVKRSPAEMLRFQDELTQLGLRYAMSERKNARGAVEEVTFNIKRELTVSLLLKSQFEHGRIIVRGKNFNGFGPVIYGLDPARVAKPLLDDFGRFLLGRPNNLLAALTPTRL